MLLGIPPESGSARLGHIPSLPWESQLPLKPYLSLQPFDFEGNCDSSDFLLDFCFSFIVQFHLLRKCGLLAHTSAAFLKNCCTKKLSFACGSFLTANIKIKKEGFKQMAIQKKGLLIGGIVAVVIAAGGICAAVLPDAV
jgi:hypothetical protein